MIVNKILTPYEKVENAVVGSIIDYKKNNNCDLIQSIIDKYNYHLQKLNQAKEIITKYYLNAIMIAYSTTRNKDVIKKLLETSDKIKDISQSSLTSSTSSSGINRDSSVSL